MKLSRYIVASSPIFSDEYRLIYSTRTGSQTYIKECDYNAINCNDFTSIPDSLKAELLTKGIIVSQSLDEIELVYDNIEQGYNNDNDLLYFVIHPTSSCQLDCSYCGQKHLSSKIQENEFLLILKRIEYKLQNGNFSKLRIAWFGGEPLLALNVIEKLTPQLKDLAFRYNCDYSSQMTTNGYCLNTKVLEKCVSLNISSFEITLDGPQKIHDNKRYTKSGEGSFDRIMENLDSIFSSQYYEMNQKKIKITIRVNVDRENSHSIMELADLLIEKNYLSKLGTFYLAPVFSFGNDAHLGGVEENEFGKIQMEFYLKLIQNKFPVRIIPKPNYSGFCVAQSKNSEVIDANGDLSICTEVSYVPKYDRNESPFFLGDIHRKNSEFKERSSNYWISELRKNEECNSCLFLPLCVGGCLKRRGEKVEKCPPYKYNFNERLLLSAFLHKQTLDKQKMTACAEF